MTTTKKTMMLAVVLGLFGAQALGCGGLNDGPDGDTVSDGAEYSEALPDTQMLALELDDSAGATIDGGPVRQALQGEKKRVREHADHVTSRVRDLIAGTHDRMKQIVENNDPIAVKEGDRGECRRWEGDGSKASWQLTICKSASVQGAFAFNLRGRELGSSDDYQLVAAGRGTPKPRQSGRKRGAGIIGYNLENYAAVTGESDYKGKLAVGYRAVREYRHVLIGLSNVETPNTSQPLREVYQYKRLRGVGGFFRFMTHADFLKADGMDGFELGQDDSPELGRFGIAWRANLKARLLGAICGGSVGQGECIYMRQCGTLDGEIDYSVSGVLEDGLEWETTSCPTMPLPAGDVPTEQELTPGESTDAEIPGPAIDEPGEDSMLEAMEMVSE